MKLRITPEAKAAAKMARSWYEKQRTGLGAAFAQGLAEVMNRIR